jgi:hypothetical protein
MLVKLLTQQFNEISPFLPRFLQLHGLILELCQKYFSYHFGALFSLVCLTAISHSKYPIGFSHKCECFVWRCHNLDCQFLTTNNRLRTWLLFSKWNESKRQIVFIILEHDILGLTLTALCVILQELMPATSDSLSSYNLRFFNYKFVHVQYALKWN